jgi:hypothetical protein
MTRHFKMTAALAALLIAAPAAPAFAQHREDPPRPERQQPDRPDRSDQDRDRQQDRDRDQMRDHDGDGEPDQDRDRDRDQIRDRAYMDSASSLFCSGLLTSGERAQFQIQMGAAQTDAERARIREEHRARIAQRAGDLGIAMGPDGLQSEGLNRYMMAQMLTDQERLEFHARMGAAETDEAREAERAQMREMLRERLRLATQTMAGSDLLEPPQDAEPDPVAGPEN